MKSSNSHCVNHTPTEKTEIFSLIHDENCLVLENPGNIPMSCETGSKYSIQLIDGENPELIKFG